CGGRANLPEGAGGRPFHIPRWDFKWQDEYRYREPLHLPRGTLLSMEYVYDNSAANPHNPHKPPARVYYGAHASDEMGDLWIQVLPSNNDELAMLHRVSFEKDLSDDTKHAEMEVARNPADANAHYRLATCLLRAGRMTLAEAHLQKSVALSPAHADAQNALGLMRAEQGDRVAAIAHFRRALAAKPDVADFHFNVSTVLQAQGQTGEAVQHLKHALTLDADHAGAHNNLGLLLAAQGQIDTA